MNKIILLIFALFCFGVVACGTGSVDDSNQLTTIGNPPTPIPDGGTNVVKGMVEKFLLDKPNMKGDIDHNTGLFYFDVVNKKIIISKVGVTEKKEVSFEITNDGAVVSSDNVIGGVFDTVNNDLVIDYSDVTSKTTSQFFSTDIKDKNYEITFARNPLLICEVNPKDGFDSKAGLKLSNRAYVPGETVTTGYNSGECGLVVKSFCQEEGKLFADIVPSRESVNGYLVNYFECDCHNGKCPYKPGETLARREGVEVDVCLVNKAVCEVTKPPLSDTIDNSAAGSSPLLGKPIPGSGN